MKNEKDLKVVAIFDNGGGLVLKLGDSYAHYYQNMGQASEDCNEYLIEGNATDFEGNEEDALNFEADEDNLRNGGLAILNLDEIKVLVYECKEIVEEQEKKDFSPWGWHNITEFIVELADISL